MDYSLLVGLHFRDSGAKNAEGTPINKLITSNYTRIKIFGS